MFAGAWHINNCVRRNTRRGREDERKKKQQRVGKMNEQKKKIARQKYPNKVKLQEGTFKSAVSLRSQEEFCEQLPLSVNVYGQVFHLLKCQHRRKAPECYTSMLRMAIAVVKPNNSEVYMFCFHPTMSPESHVSRPEWASCGQLHAAYSLVAVTTRMWHNNNR